MQLKVFWATLMRRWYLLLLSLVCTAVATFLTVDKVGPTYEATGAVLVLPPVTSVEEGEESFSNPYLMLDGMSQVRDIVIRAIMGQTTHDELCQERTDPAYEAMREELCKQQPPNVTFEATSDYTNRAPIILVTVDADSPTNAVVALGAVMERVPKVLADLQAGLKLGANAEITSMALIADRKPEIVHKYQIRAAIVVGAGTLSLSLLMIGLYDGLLSARRSKNALKGPAWAMSAELESEAGLVTPLHSRPEPITPQHSQPEPITPQHSQPEPITPQHSQPEPITPQHSNAEPTFPLHSEAQSAAPQDSGVEPTFPLYSEAQPARLVSQQDLVTASGQEPASRARRRTAVAAKK